MERKYETAAEFIKENVEYIGTGECDVCQSMRADCAKFKVNLFFKGVICDRCCGLILRGFSKDLKGAA